MEEMSEVVELMSSKLVQVCAVVRERMIRNNEKSASISIEFGDVIFTIKCEALSDDLKSLPDETIEILGML